MRYAVGFIRESSLAPIIPLFSGVSRPWMDTKSDSLIRVGRSTGLAPAATTTSSETYGSWASVFTSNPESFRQTIFPIQPNPMRPTVFPASSGIWGPFKKSLRQVPLAIPWWERAMLRHSASIRPIEKSDTAPAFLPRTLKTTIPRSVAAARSTCSQPARHVPNILRSGPAASRTL